MSDCKFQLLITCEHGGNEIPPAFRDLFSPHKNLLKTHAGFDPGALQLAEAIVNESKCPFVYETISRLLIDQNRSSNRSSLFSTISSTLSKTDKVKLLETIYDPYHKTVFKYIDKIVESKKSAIHCSIHTFTPVFYSQIRNADVGLLYHPSRKLEKQLCIRIADKLKKVNRDIKVRMNYPYKGISDGLTKMLRMHYLEKQYSGIEIEINQKHFFEKSAIWKVLIAELPIVIHGLQYLD